MDPNAGAQPLPGRDKAGRPLLGMLTSSSLRRRGDGLSASPWCSASGEVVRRTEDWSQGNRQAWLA